MSADCTAVQQLVAENLAMSVEHVAENLATFVEQTEALQASETAKQDSGATVVGRCALQNYRRKKLAFAAVDWQTDCNAAAQGFDLDGNWKHVTGRSALEN